MTSSNQHENVSRSSRVDRLSVGKLVLDSEWRTYTPTLTQGAFGTTTTNRWTYRVIGRTLSVKATVVQTGAGTVGVGAYQFSLPTGCVAAATNRACGVANISSGSTAYSGFCGTDPSFPNHILIALVDPTAASAILSTWGSTIADTTIRLSGTSVTLYLTCDIELAASSQILQ